MKVISVLCTLISLNTFKKEQEHLMKLSADGTFDHAHIVGSISYGERDHLLVLLDQLDHLSLLQRSDPAADHRFTHARRPQELQLHAALQGVRLRDRGRKMGK